MGINFKTYTASESPGFIVPAGVKIIHVLGFGGGGGGGAGIVHSGSTPLGINIDGGGGGAGSFLRLTTIAVTSGSNYAIVIGSGGSGGTTGAGGNGTNSTFGGNLVGNFGTAGIAGAASLLPSLTASRTSGMEPTTGNYGSIVSGTIKQSKNTPGATYLWNHRAASASGFVSGIGGLNGGPEAFNGGSYRWFGGHGGSAGAGGNGGNGGNPSEAGSSPGTATNGTAAAANTGAGGGGGGSTNEAIPRKVGGAGGSGRMTIFWFD